MFLIYISGIDGCGKTTQAKLLVRYLTNQKISAQYVWLRWQPSLKRLLSSFRSLLGNRKHSKLSKEGLENSECDKWIYFKTKILSHKLIKWLWWHYACADYYFTIRKSFNKLKSDVVVVDRYLLDFLIDQAFNMRVTLTDMEKLMNNFFLKRFKPCDLNIIIDLGAWEGYMRKLDGTPLDYLKDREKRYGEIPHSDNTIHVNGLDEIDVIANKISTCVSQKLRKTRL